jgi:phage terminase large subunit-like protein
MENYPLTTRAFSYADDVLGGKITTGKWAQLACKRFYDDLKTGSKRGLLFDFDASEHRLAFYNFVKHSKAEWAGQVFTPEPWQAFIDANIFGWKRADGARRFRTVYTSVARKNGKSTQLAATGLYLAFFDNEEGSEVFTAAVKYEQSCIIHSESTRMVKSSPSLRGMINVFKNTLTCEAHNQKFVPLGQDSNTQDGLNVHAALVDEYHCHPTSGLYDVLKTGTGSRRQPMVYVITTAGFEKSYPCYEMELRIKRILEKSEDDDTVFGIIYSLDDNDDWTDQNTWIKANPNMGVSLKLDVLQDNFKEAFSMPSKQNGFKTKHLNIWTEAETRWLTMESWKLNSDPVDADGLAGRLCFAALDLSTTIDLTAWVLCFPPDGDGDKYRFLYRFFIPQDGIHERTQKEKFDYETMVRNGFITATPGNVVDYDFIKAQIYEDVRKYDIRELAYDPWNATSIITDIQNDIGATCVEFRQGFATMSPACKDFERKVLGGKLATADNPIMNWMIGCTEVVSDPAGNIKLVKPDRNKTGKHIDGVVASVMALNRAVKNEGDGPSIYETEELLIV